VLREGVLEISVNGEMHRQNIFDNDPAWAGQTFYFKGGAYVQDNKGPSSEGGRVELTRLKVTHAPLQ
jgi:hypothetical protein